MQPGQEPELADGQPARRQVRIIVPRHPPRRLAQPQARTPGGVLDIEPAEKPEGVAWVDPIHKEGGHADPGHAEPGHADGHGH